MFNQLILSHVTHLVHFAAGLRPSIIFVWFTSIHCALARKRKSPPRLPSYHLSYIGASFCCTLSFHTILPYIQSHTLHLSVYLTLPFPHITFSSHSTSSRHDPFTFFLVPSKDNIVIILENPWFFPAIIISHTTCNPFLSVILMHLFLHLLHSFHR